MAIQQVRVQINGTWHTLTYNSTTRRYETTITAPASSHSQTGGYYNAGVEVTNTGGSVVTRSGTDDANLRLVVRETSAPIITLVSPAAGYLAANAPEIIIDATDEGAGVDLDTVVVKIDNADVDFTSTAIDGGYRLTYTPSPALTEGAHTLSVSLSDYDSNPTVISADWLVDTVAPSLSITSPTDGTTLFNPECLVSVEVSDATAGLQSVTINGTPVAVSGGTASTTLQLTEGDTEIVAIATDRAGNTTTASVSVTYDAGAPVITVTAPTEGAATNQTTITTTGTVIEDATGVESFTINGNEIELIDDAFSVEIDLTEGANVIEYSATDGSGQTGSVIRHVTLDTIAPELTVNTPADGQLFNTTQIAFSGTVSDSGTGLAWVEVDGEAVTPEENGDFSAVVDKIDGQYSILTAAMDNAGNKTEIIRRFTIDTEPPVITVSHPIDGQTITERPIIVTGTAYDLGVGLRSLTVNGVEVDVNPDTNVFATEIDPPEGASTLTLVATDNAGSQTVHSMQLFVDSKEPELYNNYYRKIIDTKTVKISGQVWDVTSPPVELLIGGTAVTVDENGRYSYNCPVDIGDNSIEVSATDGSGLNTSITLRVIRLITDRRRADVDALKNLYTSQNSWTATTVESFAAATHRGAYNYTDFNRVLTAVDYMASILVGYGFANPYQKIYPADGRLTWQGSDIPTIAQTGVYLDNIERIRAALPVSTVDTTETMEAFSWGRANDIEQILVDVDAMFYYLEIPVIQCGEAFSGEF